MKNLFDWVDCSDKNPFTNNLLTLLNADLKDYIVFLHDLLIFDGLFIAALLPKQKSKRVFHSLATQMLFFLLMAY